jgi:hypothetical protein
MEHETDEFENWNFSIDAESTSGIVDEHDTDSDDGGLLSPGRRKLLRGLGAVTAGSAAFAMPAAADPPDDDEEDDDEDYNLRVETPSDNDGSIRYRLEPDDGEFIATDGNATDNVVEGGDAGEGLIQPNSEDLWELDGEFDTAETNRGEIDVLIDGDLVGTFDEDGEVSTESEDEDDDYDDDEEQLDEDTVVVFEDQVTDDDSVVVEELVMPVDGYMSIHDGAEFIDDDGGVAEGPGSIIGYSDYLEPGEYEDLEVELDESINEASVIVALPHQETSDDEDPDFRSSDTEEDKGFKGGLGGDTDKAPPSGRTNDVAAVIPLDDNEDDFDISV